MDYKTFTHNLMNYHNNKICLVHAEMDLELILYDLCGVHGVSYDTVLVSGNPLNKALKWLDQEDKYNEKENECEYYRKAIQSVDDIKKRLPEDLWSMLTDKFVKGMTYEQLGQKHGYSANGMWVYLKRETERYL